MKVFVYSARPYDCAALQEAAEDEHELVFSDKRLTEETVYHAQGCDTVSIFTSAAKTNASRA